ncbi:MAG TPA: VWA domain-containing protein [Verrucomicrobiae bacterium]|nr:VWA domain-containing protein [Verrucomicrobiae bacterium]
MRFPATFLMVLVVLLFCGSALAQTQPAPASAPSSPAGAGQSKTGASSDDPKPDDQISTTRVIRNEVNLIFTVTDKHGKFIKDLQLNQFKVLDNNRPPQVLKVESQTDLPLRVGLLIDASNSIRDRFLFEQQAAVEFLQQTLRPQTDKAFVIAFDEIPEVTQPFTNDQDKLTKGIKIIRPGGGTALWDAVYTACKDQLIKQQQKEAIDVRNVIVLVSDGDDNQSRVLRQEAIEMAQRANVIVYSISTNLSNIQDTGDKNLKFLAEATGGRAFFPFKLQDLADDFNAIQGELRSQYSMYYKPESLVANGQFHSIQISALDKKLKVRAKKGYFAPK